MKLSNGPFGWDGGRHSSLSRSWTISKRKETRPSFETESWRVCGSLEQQRSRKESSSRLLRKGRDEESRFQTSPLLSSLAFIALPFSERRSIRGGGGTSTIFTCRWKESSWAANRSRWHWPWRSDVSSFLRKGGSSSLNVLPIVRSITLIFLPSRLLVNFQIVMFLEGEIHRYIYISLMDCRRNHRTRGKIRLYFTGISWQGFFSSNCIARCVRPLDKGAWTILGGLFTGAISTGARKLEEF